MKHSWKYPSLSLLLPMLLASSVGAEPVNIKMPKASTAIFGWQINPHETHFGKPFAKRQTWRRIIFFDGLGMGWQFICGKAACGVLKHLLFSIKRKIHNISM